MIKYITNSSNSEMIKRKDRVNSKTSEQNTACHLIEISEDRDVGESTDSDCHSIVLVALLPREGGLDKGQCDLCGGQ